MQPTIDTEPIIETRGDDWTWPLMLMGDDGSAVALLKLRGHIPGFSRCRGPRHPPDTPLWDLALMKEKARD